MFSEDHEKAAILNKYFASVFVVEELSNIPQPSPSHKIHPKIDNVEISEDIVRQKLSRLNCTSSQGPDSIHPRVLKEAAEHLARPLSVIFRKTISTGCLPSDWKLGQVVPIFKKGDRHDPGNYRPISLTSIPCKILESIIKDQLMCHLESNELLSKDQHGFRSRRSCTSQLLEVIDEWSISFEEGKPVDVLYLDFKKAFDSVPHQRLLSKLETYSITGHLRCWISSFLSGRSQRVVVRGCHSPWAPVLSSVPQGSVLGPGLFIIYINDLPDSVRSSIKIFADDTKIYHAMSCKRAAPTRP